MPKCICSQYPADCPTRPRDPLTALGLFLLAAVLGALLIEAAWRGLNIPACREDAVLVGVGDYNRGRWSSYACGPALDNLGR